MSRSFRGLAPFQHLNWNPDGKELRGFALAMLVGFTLLGLAAAWRHGEIGLMSLRLWGAGVLLAASSLVPGLGRLAYLGVYIPSSLMGFVVSRVLLTLVFCVVFVPIGLIMRCGGKDVLDLSPNARPRWLPHRVADKRRRYYRQY